MVTIERYFDANILAAVERQLASEQRAQPVSSAVILDFVAHRNRVNPCSDLSTPSPISGEPR